MDVELVQFRYSPYNEKVRWALDVKRVPHLRRSLMPGPHRGTVGKLTGQTATPILRIGQSWTHGSARILDELERRWPAPALMPADTAQRAAALEVQRRFDEDWGPRIRRSVLAAAMTDLGYFRDIFAEGQSAPARLVYRALLPFALGLVRKGNGISGPEAIADGDRATLEALDFVAAQSGATGYLVGEAFSVADLAAASFLATVVDPLDSTMARPQPMAPGFRGWLQRWQAHKGADWVRTVYARHRAKGRDWDGLHTYD
ncbi:MAG: glutathione S-transferase [Alphaproteobacteria bacterium]|nr:glutathione S-transferase [Alphaproteobacteria bacterium]